MPIDINMLRPHKGGDIEKVKQSEYNRRFSEEAYTLVDNIVAMDTEWTSLKKKVDEARQQKNELNKQVGKKKKAKEPCDDLMAEAKAAGQKVVELEVRVQELRDAIDRELPKIGNFVHETVPISNDEEKDSVVVNKFGEFLQGDQFESHHNLLWRIGGYEPERGVAAAGHRGYFLTGPGVMLNQALINYSLQFLVKEGYTPVQPPYFMNKDVMAGVAQLSQFDEELYHVKLNNSSDDDKYLIATSEQPICAYHKNDWLEEKELPIKYAGFSTCFRKEAGKHGKDTWGIFRVHQFDKIEQFCITTPEDSWEMHEKMRDVAERFLQSLGLPYRVINIVSGELNNAAAKKYDIEGWFPGYGEFKELVSCSNCLDYQARSMETRCGQKKQGEVIKKYCHFLNSTLCALTRTICAIMENYQTEDGVRVPEVLQPFMMGTEFLPFVREKRDNLGPKTRLATAARQKGEAKAKAKKKAGPPAPTPIDPKALEAAKALVGDKPQDAVKELVTSQSGKVRELKAQKAEKAVLDEEIALLIALKSLALQTTAAPPPAQ